MWLTMLLLKEVQAFLVSVRRSEVVTMPEAVCRQPRHPPQLQTLCSLPVEDSEILAEQFFVGETFNVAETMTCTEMKPECLDHSTITDDATSEVEIPEVAVVQRVPCVGDPIMWWCEPYKVWHHGLLERLDKQDRRKAFVRLEGSVFFNGGTISVLDMDCLRLASASSAPTCLALTHINILELCGQLVQVVVNILERLQLA